MSIGAAGGMAGWPDKPRWLASFLMCVLLAGCAPVMIVPGMVTTKSRITDDAFMTADGAVLKLSRWDAIQPKAIVVAIHGFNDYRRFFSAAAEYLSQRGITSYAYDQRGFGESPHAGSWAGSDAYADDLRQFSQLIRVRHPGLPVYLLGESMGGAIIIDAMARPERPDADGVILSAPAVWGRETMPWYQTSLLWTLHHTLPWLRLSGRGLGYLPSDNIDMLRALGRDPLVIKETRVDAIYGLTNLMDSALNSAQKLNIDTLLLYGQKDQIIPAEPTSLFVQDLLLHGGGQKTVAYYENGYHMLLRDLQAPVIWQDIAHWIIEDSTTLPSGADRNLDKLLSEIPVDDSVNVH